MAVYLTDKINISLTYLGTNVNISVETHCYVRLIE